MRKLVLQMQMTINGFVGGPNGENDWMTLNPDDAFINFMSGLLDNADTLLIGRKLAEGGFIKFWQDTAVNNPAHPFAKKIADISKIVFTKTLDQSTWNNTTLATGDLTTEITSLKNKEGKDILVFGGADFVSSLIKENLVDEYYLIINPTAMAGGMTIFGSLNHIKKFTPVESKLYAGGKTVLHFKPVQE